MTRTCRRPGRLVVLSAAAAIGLAACSHGPSSPEVASLATSSTHSSGDPASGSSGGGNSAGPGSKGNATQLVDDWAACMRSHGDPNQSDPVINSDSDIEISMTNVSSGDVGQAHSSSGPCGHYLAAASSALRDGQPMPKRPDEAKLLRYARCMQANGVPKYPDPVSGQQLTTHLNDIGMSLNSPVFVKANDLCSKKTGVPSGNGPGPAGVVQVRSCNAPAGIAVPGRRPRWAPGPGGLCRSTGRVGMAEFSVRGILSTRRALLIAAIALAAAAVAAEVAVAAAVAVAARPRRLVAARSPPRRWCGPR